MHDIAIIGAGLAGTILARRLLEAGVDGTRIALLDAGGGARGSDVPAALMHPFPGRSMEPKAGQMRSAKASVDLLRTLSAEIGDDAIRELPMVRPLLGEMGDKLRSTWEQARADYPAWFDSRLASGADLAELADELGRFEQVLVYTPAFSVDTASLDTHLSTQIGAAGAAVYADTTVERVERRGGGWRLRTDSGEVDAKQVVLAAGWGLRTWFEGLPIRGRGGESLVVRPPPEARLACIVNASGHVAPGSGDTWVAGSTYWSPDEFDQRSDAAAVDELVRRCARLTPAIRDGQTVELWRGIRAMYRGDNRPLVGGVAEIDGLYVFGALGSKGLLRIPELAAQLADLLLGRGQIDERATTHRVDADKWRPNPERVVTPTIFG
jgi:glycine/D-amino acid oxidase-like deaminating enzyme